MNKNLNYSTDQRETAKKQSKLEQKLNKERKSSNSSRLGNSINLKIQKHKNKKKQLVDDDANNALNDSQLIRINRIYGLNPKFQHIDIQHGFSSLQTANETNDLLYKNQIHDYYGDKYNNVASKGDGVHHSKSYKADSLITEDNTPSRRNKVNEEYLILSNDNHDFDSKYVAKSTRLKVVSPKVFNIKDGNDSLWIFIIT